MKEEELRRFEYALPYIFLPRAQEEVNYDTTVNVVTELNGKGLTFEYDWEMDEIDVWAISLSLSLCVCVCV